MDERVRREMPESEEERRIRLLPEVLQHTPEKGLYEENINIPPATDRTLPNDGDFESVVG